MVTGSQPNTPSSPAPPITAPSQPPPRRRGRWLLFGCGGLLALLLLIVATVAITLWWIQRPIKPVVLSAKEKATVDEKIRQLGGDSGAAPTASASSRPSPTTRLSAEAPDRAAPAGGPGGPYVPGGTTLKLTQRELNGLLNLNTDLGKSVRIELDQDAVNAYLAVPIPADFPIGGGRMFRARGRFRVSLGNEGAPFAVLEDVTVLGVSLPKAWLGGLKGENLLGEAMTGRKDSPVLKGIKSLRIEPGALVLEVEK